MDKRRLDPGFRRALPVLLHLGRRVVFAPPGLRRPGEELDRLSAEREGVVNSVKDSAAGPYVSPDPHARLVYAIRRSPSQPIVGRASSDPDISRWPPSKPVGWLPIRRSGSSDPDAGSLSACPLAVPRQRPTRDRAMPPAARQPPSAAQRGSPGERRRSARSPAGGG